MIIHRQHLCNETNTIPSGFSSRIQTKGKYQIDDVTKTTFSKFHRTQNSWRQKLAKTPRKDLENIESKGTQVLSARGNLSAKNKFPRNKTI